MEKQTKECIDKVKQKVKIMDYLNGLKKPWKFLAPMVGNSEEAYRILSRKIYFYRSY